MENEVNNILSAHYAKWLEETLRDLVKFPVKGIALNAITANGEVYTNYYEITMADKLVISGVVQQDAMLDSLASLGVIEYGDNDGEEDDADGEEEAE